MFLVASGSHGRVFLLTLALAAVLAGCSSTPSTPSTPRPMAASEPDGPPPPGTAAVQVPDVQPRIEPIRRGGPNKPYAVLGRSYAPVSEDLALKERGMASWYGRKFEGRRTASGELFSMHGLTAAHRTWPIPSYARVRNVATGQEIIVRVNDRGPFHSSRVIDLSYAAALKLGVVASGSAQVDIERLTFEDIRTGAWRRRDETAPGMDLQEGDPILAIAAASGAMAAQPSAPSSPDPADPADPAGAAVAAAEAPAVAAAPMAPAAPAYTRAGQGYWVQLAALSQRASIDKLQERVNRELTALAPLLAVFKEASVYRLQVGPYSSSAQARSVARQLHESLALRPMVVERR